MTPSQAVADAFTFNIDKVHNPNSMDAWSERREAQTWERLATRIAKQIEVLEAELTRRGADIQKLTLL